jgi:hypothetical protein
VLCNLQREEAARRLGELKPDILPIHIPWKRLAAGAILAILIAAVPYAPQHLVDRVPGAQQPQRAETMVILEKIERMRAEIEGSTLKDEDKRSLLAQLDTLLGRLEEGQLDIATLGEIDQMLSQLSTSVEKLTPVATYAQELLEYERLRPLGEAIIEENIDEVEKALDVLRDSLTALSGLDQVNAIMDLVYDISGTMSKPLIDDSQDTLVHALSVLSSDLEGAAALVYNKRDNTQPINRAFNGALTRIDEFLNEDETEEDADGE